MIASLPPVLDAQHDVAGVGDEAYRLTDDEHRVEADAGVGHDDARPHQTDDPEANGKNGGMAAVRVVPLVDEPEGSLMAPATALATSDRRRTTLYLSSGCTALISRMMAKSLSGSMTTEVPV